ncbi:hypothetical protein M8818_000878 [Zalaria obscura]|uniref:Uncharacterized protein n=1 Tax=Zalaria obscura TaxID=2024903 RepID=A0ACC3SLW7_9PEZI
MSFNDSNLSSPKYGYDFVLSTTQASINSGLLEYLSQEGQPIAYICFLADKNTGNPTQQIALDDLLIQTKGVNPFDIPDGTAWNDPRIQVLTKALFVCGVKIQMGLPPGVLPKDLPEPVVVLGNSANNVRFNMYCSQFSVIQNTPPSGFGGTGVWNVWSQRPGFPWYVDTTVDLITEDLDSELNTPYFNNHPKEKAALLAQLTNLSSTAFSLQQLLFDLDNAVLQSVPTFEGIPAGSNAEAILQKSFVSIYSTNAKQYGQPLLSVNAVAQQTPDPSQLHLTGIERQVSTLVDESSGVPIQNPTPVQQSATTLNYLCAVNHNPLPGAASFSWNWVEPTNIESESGVIAINRNTIANYFMKELQLLPSVRNSCVAVTTSVKAHWWGPVTYYHTFVPGQSLQSAAISESGADVISMAYESAYVKTTLDQVPQSRFVRPKRLRAILPRSKIATDPLLQTNGITTPIPTPAKSANTVPSRDTVPKITYSSQMMQNYLQGEIVSAQAKFEAVQTSDGHALLFATDSNGILNGIEEQNGKTSTGWILNDLSTAFNKAKFPGATVRTFDTGQSALDGSISLGMAVSSGGSDHLCVSLANSNEVGTWITETQWTLYPFDAPGEMLAGITIAGILFSETLDHQQYLIVDIDRSTISSVKDIARYYIDPSKSQGSYWMPHNVPVDIEDGSYQSCIGRAGGESVDGVYTLGMAGKSGQLVYVPIINIFGDGPPLPTRLGLPGDEPASAIAGARNLNEASDLYGTTDLYAIGGSTLYRFAAEEQKADNDLGRPLATNSLFAGTQKLMAMIHDGVTTLWGRNGSDDVYYLSCPSDHVSESGSWSTPVPIVYGIERVSAYVNRQDGGNTIFASGGGNLQKLIQATSTSSQMWLAQEIKLAAPLMEKSLSFNSYTTTISLADADNLPVREAELAISAKSRTPVYINGIYYVLGQTPVSVATDSTGSVTVIEAADDINGTVLMVSTSASESITINPMDEPFKKLASLDSKDALRGATFPKGIVAGGVLGPTESVHLVSSSVSDDDASANAFDGQIANVEETVNQWAGIKDWSLLGAPATSLASSSTSNPAGSQTSGSQLLSNHFRDQAGQITVLSGSPSMSVVQELIEDLLTAISKEGSILSTVYDQLAQLARDFASLDVGSMIRRIAGILANGVLSSAQVVVDALLNVLKDLAATAIGILDAKIHIPVISDILNLLGIADISFLDLFTWIAAVSYTVIYKIANDEAPFPNNNDTSSVISASDWDGLSVLFQTLPNPSATSLKAAAVHHETLNRQALTLSSALQSAVFVAGHATAGFIALTGDFVTSFEASEETGQNQWSIPSAVMGAIFAASADAADALAPKYPIENQPVSVFMKANTTAVVLAKLVFSGPAQEKFRAQESSFSGLAVQDGRATGAIVNAILIIPALFGTCWHFYELSEKPASAERSAAIIGEVSKLSTYMSRVSYAMAVNDTNPESKAIEVGAMAAINLTVAGLQTAEAIAA